jgi:hypothetical protein
MRWMGVLRGVEVSGGCVVGWWLCGGAAVDPTHSGKRWRDEGRRAEPEITQTACALGVACPQWLMGWGREAVDGGEGQ